MYDRTFDESKFTGLSILFSYIEKRFICTLDSVKSIMTTHLDMKLLHALLYELGYTHWDEEDFIEKLSTWFPFMEDINNQGRMLIENARVKEEPRSSEACISNCE